MNLKNVILIVLLMSLAVSCQKFQRPKKPDNLISKKDMVNILYDMYIVNSAKGVNVKVLEDNGIVPKTYVLNKYRIDSLQFAQSNTFYAYDVETYAQIIEDVKAKINAQKSIYEAQLKLEDAEDKRKRDSIKEARKKSIEKTLDATKSDNLEEIQN